MPSKDLHNNIKISPAIDPAAIIAGNATKAGAIIDTQGFESLEFAIVSGALTDATYTPIMNESDAANMAGETAVADADMFGTEVAASFAEGDDSVIKKIGYRGNKRYVTLDVVQAGATIGGFLCVIAIQGHPRNAPVA